MTDSEVSDSNDAVPRGVERQINKCDEAHRSVEDARLTIGTILEDVLPEIDAEADWTQEDLEALGSRIESVQESLQDIELELITPELTLEKLADSASVDSLEDIHGMTTVTVQCQNGAEFADEDLHCDGWEDEIELDAPATYDYRTEKIKLPGFSWECPECGQPHNFIVEGIGVSNLV